MKSKRKSELSPRQIQILPHILSSASYEEASRRAKISPKQIYSWLKEPLFIKELQHQRNQVFLESISQLKAAAQKAVKTLVLSLDDENPRIRLNAAEKILSKAFQGIEYYELENRLSVIEERINKALKEKDQ